MAVGIEPTVFSCVASRNRERTEHGRSAFYPAPGDRYYGSCRLWSVGHSGYSWTSSLTGNNAYFMGFDEIGIGPNINYPRAYGLQLRCLQE
ncbi:MAG: hypothetical protein K2K83_02060 [Rikenella sp.]|nr:hypothetical protein [Rikenella sp.]